MNHRKEKILLIFLVVVTALLFILDISFGPVKIPVPEIWHALTDGETAKSTWKHIVLSYRLPKAITAMIAGSGLAISGLLMQTLFRNPLAGPYVLGLTSGSSLGVALIVMGSGILPVSFAFLLSSFGITVASCIGSSLVLLAVVAISRYLRDTHSILVVGLMFSSFTGAVVGLLSWFGSAEQLQKFTFWSMGNLSNLSWESIGILLICWLAGTILALLSTKSLDALLLGENYARSLGHDIKKTRMLILISTSILAGSITAFAGPIAFVGMAVPHGVRMVLRTSGHGWQLIGNIFLGAALMLLCDMLCQLPGTDVILPINAITSLIGAPVVILLILRKRRWKGI